MSFYKVAFTNGLERTGGLIVSDDEHGVDDVVAISRLFRYSEAPLMKRYLRSPPYETWEEAFKHSFPGDEST